MRKRPHLQSAALVGLQGVRSPFKNRVQDHEEASEEEEEEEDF